MLGEIVWHYVSQNGSKLCTRSAWDLLNDLPLIKYRPFSRYTALCWFDIFFPEAINAIIAHSASAQELLRRRKVKKEYIYRHLATQHICLSPSADKATLVIQLLLHWGTRVPEQYKSHHFDETQEVSVDLSTSCQVILYTLISTASACM